MAKKTYFENLLENVDVPKSKFKEVELLIRCIHIILLYTI